MNSPQVTMNNLDSIGEDVRAQFEVKNALREQAIALSRTLTRQCANTIRAIHRQEWESARARLTETLESAEQVRSLLAEHPDLYYAGYTQDALKEVVEAHLTYALIKNEPLPTMTMLNVTPATYINGLAEASTELRRHILDIMRHQQYAEAERMLEAMDTIYMLLITMDFPDAITDGLRRRTDTVRGVLEKTRGDVTLSIQQQQLQAAVENLTNKLGHG